VRRPSEVCLVVLSLLLLGTGPTGAEPAPPPTAKVPVVAGAVFVDGLTDAAGLNPDKLTFVPGNMSSPAVVKDETGTEDNYGYDFSPDGSVLYGVNAATTTLFSVNQITGAANTIGPMATPAFINWFDLTIDPVSGKAYAGSWGNAGGGTFNLYTVNLATGATTLIQSVSQPDQLVDMSMNCAGELYAESVGQDKLYRVDPATAVATPIGAIGYDLQFAQGMDFDNATGVLHAWLFDATNTSHYSSINTATGAATPFPGGGPNGIYEGAIRTSCPPAPQPPAVDCTTLRDQVAAAHKLVRKAKAKLTKARQGGHPAAITKARKKLKKAKKKLKAAQAALAAAPTCL